MRFFRTALGKLRAALTPKGFSVKWLLTVVLLLLLLLAAVVLAATLIASVPSRFWVLLAVCLFCAISIWWFKWGANRLERRRILRNLGHTVDVTSSADKAVAARMAADLSAAMTRIRRVPRDDQGNDPLYALPWFLMISTPDSDSSGLLTSAAKGAPFSPPAPLSAENALGWRWWFFKKLVVVDCAPEFVCDPSDAPVCGSWYRALELLASSRPLMPINGIVLCISADVLTGEDARWNDTVKWMRRLIDEALLQLQVDAPLYVVITNLDRLRGFSAFSSALPQGVARQALGVRVAAGINDSAQVRDRKDSIETTIDQGLSQVLERLHAIRLAAIQQSRERATKRSVFEFVEAVEQLRNGLQKVITHLLAETALLRTPMLRAVYFTSHNPDQVFVDDLFDRFLPADQPIVKKTKRSAYWQWSRVALLSAAAVVGSLYAAYSTHSDLRVDEILSNRVSSACASLSHDSGADRVGLVALCGRAIDLAEHEAASHGPLLSFGRSSQQIKFLKKKLTDEFSERILAVYDQNVETDVSQGSVSLEHLLALSQRLYFLDTCAKEIDDCHEEGKSFNLMFDPGSTLYSPFKAPGSTATSASSKQASDLLFSYLGYVRWQDKDILTEERSRVMRLLEKALSSYRPADGYVPDIQKWANARFQSHTLAAFWGFDGGELPSGELANVRVSFAYTRRFWEGLASPFASRISQYAPAYSTRVNEFQAAYRSAYFSAWQRLLEKFDRGYELWKGRQNRYIASTSLDSSPHERLWKAVDGDVYSLPLRLTGSVRWGVAWGEIKHDWTASPRILWSLSRDLLRTALRRYTVTQYPPWIPALLTTHRTVLLSQRATYAKAYLRLQREDAPSDSYKIAAEIFRTRGNPTEPPASDYSPLLQLVDKPPEHLAEQFKPEDERAWGVARGPYKLLLSLLVYRAGQMIQTKWRSDVTDAVEKVPVPQRAEWLYGKDGKINAFIADYLKPFVSESGKQPVDVAGVTLPFKVNPRDVERKLMQVTQAAGGESGDQPFDAGVFYLSQPSTWGVQREGAAGTKLEVECRERTFQITSTGSMADQKKTVFWSPKNCPQAILRVSLPDSASNEARNASDGALPLTDRPERIEVTRVGTRNAQGSIQVTRVYSGPEGMRTLLREFQSGSHRFALADFKAYHPDKQQWAEIQARAADVGVQDTHVYLRVELSDAMRSYLSLNAGDFSNAPKQLFE